MDYRTLLAAVLGVGLGAVLIAAPEAILRAHTVGRVPGERGGEYGTDDEPGDGVRRLIRVVGGALVLAGLYFGAVAVGTV
ncbi:hypothetical protein C475_08782 [Halosimplex carlsbadense 2-9-1]|uniref:DUF6199 domain-containing protein n=1 Tax=Halosimplex carlsbadense 2-9-1 TaxID=797114 RepID=M0CTV0_9EURY|nr:hypothetical protein [Halosimplex carlsbadense]ELZ26636.1 hypothetical protein C475_08782 [Halosimplex carlsbadense 2-9-1]